MDVTLTLIASTHQAITHVSVNQALKVQAHNAKVQIHFSIMYSDRYVLVLSFNAERVILSRVQQKP